MKDKPPTKITIAQELNPQLAWALLIQLLAEQHGAVATNIQVHRK